MNGDDFDSQSVMIYNMITDICLKIGYKQHNDNKDDDTPVIAATQ